MEKYNDQFLITQKRNSKNEAFKIEEFLCSKCGLLLLSKTAILFVDIPRPGTHIETYLKCPACNQVTQLNIFNKLRGFDINGESFTFNMEPLFSPIKY